jgi:hypothetical protein
VVIVSPSKNKVVRPLLWVRTILQAYKQQRLKQWKMVISMFNVQTAKENWKCHYNRHGKCQLLCGFHTSVQKLILHTMYNGSANTHNSWINLSFLERITIPHPHQLHNGNSQSIRQNITYH